MQRFILALRAFFRILGSATLADEIRRLLAAPSGGTPGGGDAIRPTPAQAPAAASAQQKSAAKRPAAERSAALTLLAALQRDGRLVDFLQEPIGGYSDTQIGAAMRDIHRDCAALLGRVFGIEPVESAAEGSPIEVPAGFDPARIRLTGNVTGAPPFRGTLRHHGWQATRCDLPAWSGGDAASLVITPAEVEV